METCEDFNNCVDKVSELREKLAKRSFKSEPNCNKIIETTQHLLENFNSLLEKITADVAVITKNADKVKERLEETQGSTVVIGRNNVEKFVRITETVKETLQKNSEKATKKQHGLEAVHEFLKTAETGLIALGMANLNSEQLSLYNQNFSQVTSNICKIEKSDSGDEEISKDETDVFVQLLPEEYNGNDSTPRMILSENVTTSSPLLFIN